MKDMCAMGVFLFVVAAIAGVMLGITEAVTAPRIAENQRLAFEEARKAVLPGSTAFKMIHLPVQDDAGKQATQTFSLGFDAQGTFLGTVQMVSPKGYGGAIDMALGLKPDLQVSGVKIQSQKETPGLGTKLEEQSFLGPFMAVCEKLKDKANFRVKQDGGDIDGITAATISSRAFCKGVRDGLDRARSHQERITVAARKGPPAPVSSEKSTGEAPAPHPSPLPAPGTVPQGGTQ